MVGAGGGMFLAYCPLIGGGEGLGLQSSHLLLCGGQIGVAKNVSPDTQTGVSHTQSENNTFKMCG